MHSRNALNRLAHAMLWLAVCLVVAWLLRFARSAQSCSN
jgi:hypothetical protein